MLHLQFPTYLIAAVTIACHSFSFAQSSVTKQETQRTSTSEIDAQNPSANAVKQQVQTKSDTSTEADFAVTSPELTNERLQELLRKREAAMREIVEPMKNRDYAALADVMQTYRKVSEEAFGTHNGESLGIVSEQIDLALLGNDLAAANRLYLVAIERSNVLFGPSSTASKFLLAERDRILTISKEDLNLLQLPITHQFQAMELLRANDHEHVLVEKLKAIDLIAQYPGKESLAYASALHAAAGTYVELNDDDKAMDCCQGSLEIMERNWSRRSCDFADVLATMAKIHQRRGEYELVEEKLSEVLNIRSKMLGGRHPDWEETASLLEKVRRSGLISRRDTLWIAAKTNRDNGKFGEALTQLDQVFAMEKQILGEARQELLSTLDLQASVAQADQKFDQAIEYRRQAFEIGQQVYSADAYQLVDLRLALSDSQQYAKLTDAQRQQLANASRIKRLAMLYESRALYANAETLYSEAKEIEEKILGTEHPDYATSLNRIAELYESIGDYAKSEPLYLEAKVIREKVLGREHPDYATSLDNLASLCVAMADFVKAEPLHLEAKAIREKVQGKEHPDYAASLNYLAMLYKTMGEFTKAEPLYLEAKAIDEKLLSNDPLDLAATLNNLAKLYAAMGDYAKAGPLHQEAAAIWGNVLGKEHPDYATSLNNIGELYDKRGDYAKAESHYLESKAIREKVLGNEHPRYATSLNNLAALYYSMKDYAKAEPLYEEGLSITRKHLEATSIVLTERQQMVMDQSLRYRLDSYLDMSFAAPKLPKNPVENTLLWKGSVMRRLRGLRQAADDPAIADQFSKLQSVAGLLSKVAQQTPAPEQAAAWRERLAALTAEREALEKQMVRVSAAFAQAVKPIGLTNIQQAIPSDGVLIDYLEFNGKNGRQLLASIVKHDAEPTMVLLGKVSDLQSQVDLWRKSFVEEDHVDAKIGTAAGLAIRQQVWEPLLSHIGDAKTVLVSTDGVLGRLPLGALPGKQPETYLIEEHRLVLLPVPQLLPDLMEKPADRQMLREMLLIGDVDYQANPKSTKPADDPEPSPRKRPWERAERIDKIRGTLQWDPLEETGREVEFIGGMYRRLFKPSATALVDLRKAQATETAFREQAPGSTYLHVATHGFFAAADKQSALSGEQIAKRGEDRNMFGENREVLRGYSPGQLSGLVFAGANRMNEAPLTPDPSPRSGARGDRDRDREDDGILTADEIAYLRLEGTRLVVLSACETGLGEVAGGEGLIGIQRGFQLAGARSTVSSLWKVNDAATRRLMEEFYTNFLEREMSMLDALREAQLWALRNPKDVPRGATIDLPNAKMVAPEQKRLSPRYWAAFVLSGDWR